MTLTIARIAPMIKRGCKALSSRAVSGGTVVTVGIAVAGGAGDVVAVG
jgi:hypothetical protein